MEATSSPGCVGEPSSSRRRRRLKQSRKSLAESPPSLPRTPQKKRKRRRDTSSAEFYSVKQILAEKIGRGQEISYLIDWDDNPETGESYTPTWEPFDNVNKQAVDEWIENGRQVPVKGEGQRSPKEHTQPPASSIDPSRQLIRPAKRLRPIPPPSSILSNFPPAKKPRRAGTVETARFQSVSQETVDFQGKPTEIKDSCEDEQSLSIGSECIQFRVEIPLKEEFDRDAYLNITVTSSGPSQETSSSQPSQLSRPSNPVPLSRFKTATPYSFIWDSEEDLLVPEILDSQVLPASSSHKPTQTQVSKTGVATQQSTSTDTEADLATPRILRSPSPVPTGASLRYGQSDPANQPSRFDGLDESEETSEPVHSSTIPARVLVSEEQLSTSAAKSQDNHIGSTASEPLETSLHSSSPRARLGTSNSAYPTNLPTSSETGSLNQAFERSSQAATCTPSWQQPHQPSQSVSDESSAPFQTQIPLPTQDENNSQSPLRSRHVSRTSHEERTSRPATQSEAARSHPSSPDSLQVQSLAPTRNSISSSEATWQDAQIVPASSQFHTQQDEATSGSSQRDPPRRTQDAEIQTSTISSPGNLDVTTRRSRSNSPEHFSPGEGTGLNTTDPGHYLDQLSDNVLPRIEQNPDKISSPAPIRLSSTSSNTANLHRTYEPYSTPPPKDTEMADQAMGEMSTAERLRQARTAAAELKMAEQRAVRMASAIPHTPPPPPVNKMLPLRETAPEAPVVVAESAPSLKATPEQEIHENILQVLPLGDNIFTVPLPMVSMGRDIYDQEITNYRSQRRSFLHDDEIDETLLEDIDMMIERLKMICDHQDLIIADSATQQAEPDHRQARWAENISTKCIFLAELFNSLRSMDTHVVLLVRSGRMMDILETIFRTNSYSYSRPERDSNQAGQGPLRVSLLSTDVGAQTALGVGQASLVIAFDSTFVNRPFVDSLRANHANVNRLAPLLHLVITHSVEHLGLCIKKNMSLLDRMALLVSSISHTREDMGKLPSEYLTPDAAAKAIAGFIVDGAVGEWPLLPMPDIEGIEPMPEIIVEEESDVPHVSGSTTQSYDFSNSAGLQPAFKRPLLDDDDSESSKRQRMTPVEGVSSSGTNVSRVEETVLATVRRAGAEVKGTRTIIPKSDAFDASQKETVSSLLKQITELENKLRAKEATETELRQTNQRLEARCRDYESSFEKITPKYQEALNERGQAAHGMQESLARETSMRQKLDSRTAEITKLREEKTPIDAELVSARTALSSSSIPEVAELQKLKDDLQAAKSENEKAQKKIASAQNDREYMLSNYQNASNAAAEMRNELEELKARNTDLARRASDNAVEIHRLQAAADTKLYLSHIERLEAEKAEIESELATKSEELRTLVNGRRPTRGASVPRSPRTGTMSPAQSARPVARVLGVTGSRGTSPAGGGAERAYRGQGTFGDALYPPTGGVGRWGNHLS